MRCDLRVVRTAPSVRLRVADKPDRPRVKFIKFIVQYVQSSRGAHPHACAFRNPNPRVQLAAAGAVFVLQQSMGG